MEKIKHTPKLPCPFCGGEDLEVIKRLIRYQSVQCDNCGATGPVVPTHLIDDGLTTAEHDWNRRA